MSLFPENLSSSLLCSELHFGGGIEEPALLHSSQFLLLVAVYVCFDHVLLNYVSVREVNMFATILCHKNGSDAPNAGSEQTGCPIA